MERGKNTKRRKAFTYAEGEKQRQREREREREREKRGFSLQIGEW